MTHWCQDWYENSKEGLCWVCGRMTNMVLPNFGYQHPDCDMFPNADDEPIIYIDGQRVDNEGI